MKRTPQLRSRLFRAVFEGSYDAIFIHEPDGRVIDVNGRVLELYGLDYREALNVRIADVSAPSAPVAGLAKIWEEVVAGRPRYFPWKAMRPKTGEVFDVDVYLTRMPIGRRQVILAHVRDMSRQREAEQRLKLFERVFESSAEGITITDPDGTIVAVNDAFVAITGYPRQEAIGRNPRILKSEHHDEGFYRNMWESLTTSGSWSGEIWNRNKAGEAYPEWLSIGAIRDEEGVVTHYVAVFHDISDSKRREERIRHQAMHDPLTGLPNRSLLLDRLAVAIQRSRRGNDALSVLFFDLDNFKQVNDSLGHAAGDELLRQVAGRVSALVRGEDTVARLGGDEFVVVLGDTGDADQARVVAGRIVESLSAPFHLRGQVVYVSASIGISRFPDDGSRAEELIQLADSAMYRSKDRGKGVWTFYRPDVPSVAPAIRRSEHVSPEERLRSALARDEITVAFQPRLGPDGALVAGAEALARWVDGQGATHLPGDFVPLAEELGMCVLLDHLVIEKSCEAALRLIGGLQTPFCLTVNISPRHLRQADLVAGVAAILERTGFPPQFLELEISERALMGRHVEFLGRLRELAGFGIRIGIDDFGTGYSSVSALRELPVTRLQIDRNFVQAIDGDGDRSRLVETVIAMARTLDLSVLAEGVETLSQLTFLTGRGLDGYQGFYFSPALSIGDFKRYMEAVVIAPAAAADKGGTQGS